MKTVTSHSTQAQGLQKAISGVIAPLVWADGGDLYVVRADTEMVALHLSGRFSGCPGNQVLTREVLAPAIRAVAPNAQVQVSSGPLIPEGAVVVMPPAEGRP